MRGFKSPKVSNQRQIELEQYAWRNRHAMTESEALLWQALRGRGLGVQFRRQAPLCGRYIADFLAPSARLVVEVDGDSHRARSHADARRDRVLARHGYKTLRIPAELVRRNLPAAVARIDALVTQGRKFGYPRPCWEPR